MQSKDYLISLGFKLAKIEAGPFIIRSLKLLTENDSKIKAIIQFIRQSNDSGKM
jgi:hypothetical protein